MRRAVSAVACTLACVALAGGAACGDERGEAAEPSGSPERSTKPPPETAEVDETGTVMCTAEPPNVLVAPAPEVRAVAIVATETGGLVLFAEGPDQVGVQPIDVQARPVGELAHVAMPAAEGLFTARSVGERFVALADGRCAEGPCLAARAFDASGRAVGDAVTVPLERALLTRRVRATDRAVILARSHAEGPPLLDRFELGDAGLTHLRTVLGQRHPPRDRRVELLGLAADGERWAVAWRAGAVEARDSELVVTTHASEMVLEPRSEPLLFESFEWHEDELFAVAAFEMSRPRLLRFTPSADAPRRGARATPIEVRASPPIPPTVVELPPFESRRQAALRARDHRLELEVRSLAGDLVTEVLVAAITAGVAADVTRVGEAFLVAYAGPEANGRVVNASRVHCHD